MRLLLSSLVVLLSGSALLAQITVTNSTFFAAGDTLRLATAGNPEAIVAGAAGTNLSWDFSTLEMDTAIQILVKDAATGSAFASFPSAEVFQETGFGETYFNISSTAITNLGFLTNGFAGVPVNITPKYNPALVERRAPMNYIDINTAEASFLISFSTEIVPDTFFSGVPFKPDSIRVNQMIDRLDFVDAWGTISIPGADYPCLRERRRTISETTVELQIFGLWVDLGSLGLQFPGVGKDTTLAYYYFSATEKEPIAVVTVNPDNESETFSVQYKDNGVSSIHQPRPFASPLFKGPQPAGSEVRFDLSPLTHPVDLRILNTQGQLVLAQSGLSGLQTIDLSGLTSGTYFYQVLAKGQLMESGSLLRQ